MYISKGLGDRLRRIFPQVKFVEVLAQFMDFYAEGRVPEHFVLSSSLYLKKVRNIQELEERLDQERERARERDTIIRQRDMTIKMQDTLIEQLKNPGLKLDAVVEAIEQLGYFCIKVDKYERATTTEKANALLGYGGLQDVSWKDVFNSDKEQLEDLVKREEVYSKTLRHRTRVGETEKNLAVNVTNIPIYSGPNNAKMRIYVGRVFAMRILGVWERLVELALQYIGRGRKEVSVQEVMNRMGKRIEIPGIESAT